MVVEFRVHLIQTPVIRLNQVLLCSIVLVLIVVCWTVSVTNQAAFLDQDTVTGARGEGSEYTREG